jgi:hypothetical protein
MAIARLEFSFGYVGKNLTPITKNDLEEFFDYIFVEYVSTLSMPRVTIVRVDYFGDLDTEYYYLSPRDYEEWKEEHDFREVQKVNWIKEGF